MKFEAQCPKCREALSDSSHPVSGSPGIRVKARVGGREGMIWISSRFGSLEVDVGEMKIPSEEVVEFFCPHCSQKISNGGVGNCVCKAPMIVFEVALEVQVCSRRGCRWHRVGGAKATEEEEVVPGGSWGAIVRPEDF